MNESPPASPPGRSLAVNSRPRPAGSRAPFAARPASAHGPALRGAVAYFVLATAWIIFSDQLLVSLSVDPATLARYSILKGAAFVALTALLLYGLLYRNSLRHAAETAKLRRADEQWQELAAQLDGELARTERTQQMQQETENRLRILLRAVEQSPASILITNTRGEIDYVNSRFTQVTGYSFSEVRGRNPRILKSEGTPREVHTNLWATISQGREWHGDLCNRRKNGELYWESAAISPILDPAGNITHYLAVKEDITERKDAEDRLRASEERFREVVETISEVFWVYDPIADETRYLSPSFERVWGVKVENVATSFQLWANAIHPEDRDRVLAAFAQLQQESFEQTYRITRADGAVRWIRDQAFCIKSPAGQVTRVIGVAEDITEMKEMERRFLRTQRLEAIGTLASGVAHDMNNILAPILFAPALLKDRLPNPADRELLQLIEQSAQRGANIVRQLLTYSRGTDRAPEALHVDHLAKEILQFMRETFPRDISVEWRCVGELPPIVADATQIHQVFLNLCVNARDAMPHGGRLTLTAEPMMLDAATAALHDGAAPGQHVRIRFNDTGMGIPPHVLERIFDPFFTTKPVGKGTGLGLSTVLGIVRSHGGFVTVQSVEGSGSTFDVHLPAAPTAAAVAPTTEADQMPRGRGELIMLVDDEDALKQAMELLLRKFGYRTVTARDGSEALAAWTPEVKLVVTDLMMPRTSGYALIRELKARGITVPVIATTGLENADVDRMRQELPIAAVLRKPAGTRAVLESVHQVLAGKTPPP